jgi:hypothetical protein
MQRATVSLNSETISSIVSADGRVVKSTNGWVLEAPATAPDVTYRLLTPPIGVKALVEGGPAGFDCVWAGLGQAEDGSVTLRCSIPTTVQVAPGMAGTMVLQMGEPTDATALPIQAVVGSQGQGQVVVVKDGKTTLRSLTLGISDAYWIEVTGGLQGDEQVLEYPTQADFAIAAKS